MPQVKDFLDDARSLEREDFILRHPEACLVVRTAEGGGDPRREYSSTLKLEINPQTREVRVAPIPPAPTDAVLLLKKGDRSDFAGKILVGRTETNDVVVSDLTVSKHHAFFRWEADDACVLMDTESTNGTRVNGALLAARQSHRLYDGDEVAFGDVKFTFYTAGGFFDLLRSLSAIR